MVRKLKGPPRPVIRPAPVVDRDALLQRAAAHYNAGRLDDADAVYVDLCARDPQDAMPRYLRGLLAYEGKRYDEALGHLRRVLELESTSSTSPSRYDVETWLATVLTAMRHFDAARAHLLNATELAGSDVERLAALIPLLNQAHGFDAMEPLLRRMLALDVDHPVANAEFALLRYQSRDFESAVQHAERALRKDPGAPAALRVLAHVHHELGELKTSLGLYRAAVESVLADQGFTNLLATYESMLGALVYANVSDDALRASHERWQTFVLAQPRPRRPLRPRAGRPLRIGYVSPDFRQHAVCSFFEPLLQNHDPEFVSPILYSNASRHDQASDRLRTASTGWREIVALNDEQVADLIEQDKVDILVDLAGYTVGNRMGVFHLRPAPLQVNYLGYPSTTGLAQMDYRFTDEDCDPLGETDAVYSERLVRLPGGFYAWSPPADAPSVAPPPALANGFVTFGSLNTLSKITEHVVDLWSRLLRAVPDSRLVLQAGPLGNDWMRARILARFTDRGIDPSRLDLLGSMSMFEHLDVYSRIDVALDPFPWGGHTTTCTALFMGAPVVTLRGRRMASRMSASVLHRLGLDAWIAEPPAQYLDIARRLALDVDLRAELRSMQRAALLASDLTDGHRLARVVEAAYQALWDHHAGP